MKFFDTIAFRQKILSLVSRSDILTLTVIGCGLFGGLQIYCFFIGQTPIELITSFIEPTLSDEEVKSRRQAAALKEKEQNDLEWRQIVVYTLVFGAFLIFRIIFDSWGVDGDGE